MAAAIPTPVRQHHHLPAAIAVPRTSLTADANPYPALAGHALHNIQDTSYGTPQGQYRSPSPAPATATAYSPAGSTAGGNSASGRAAATPPANGLGGRSVSGGLPGLPSSFPELEQLTSTQLQRLLSDQVALEVSIPVLALLEMFVLLILS